MPDVREVYEMVTKQKEPAPGALQRQQRRQIRTARNRKIGAIAAAAAIVVAGVVVILGFRGGQTGTTPAGEPETASPAAPAPVEVAQGFVEAFGAFDADRAIAYLPDDVNLDMDARTVEEFRLELSLLEAMGYEQILVESCRETGTSASGTAVRCPLDWHGIRSDEIGLGPYPGNWDLTVRDGEIASVSLDWNIDKFPTDVGALRPMGVRGAPPERRGDVQRQLLQLPAHPGIGPALGAANPRVRRGGEARHRGDRDVAMSPAAR